ncbi:DNA helicase-2 / ATP-dependent DNA helicase PcrA [Pseudobutyrivibrio sp. ACV-2]|uniref:ATP-dependent helicase n=1 Tax=Pseudobutyrivibrio sp. ACV-2 TaxID=1520801 RepID=UPI00089B4B02|nr:ATP-dependent helicase [Pseudobutyrivibrio sp. ACV-2]SDZ86466.1 DNA helicase-2 / ATP-dependent DNA helicase PcrA [Pseudobutyrivibrio sp. ACV-2]
MELNVPQKQAVFHKEGPCLVIAGPGSGKTAVLTKRISELINSGVPAQEILVITFTKAAAIEMKERFNRLSDDVHPVTFGTFHSLFWGILQKEKGFKSSDIIMGQMRNKILKEAMTIADIDKDDIALANSYITELSTVNNKNIDLESYEPKYADATKLKCFIEAYESLKAKYHVIDFDDMLIKAYQLFIDRPDILNKWQHRFSYYLVDEMQDMNDLQFKLTNLLADRTHNLFCVGDDDQSIYGFRGSNPKIMRDFMEYYPNAKQIVLDYNYRNPANVVKSAGLLIGKNENRFEKNIKSTVGDGNIQIIEKKSPAIEAEFIINKIGELRKNGTSYDEIAVLYRNHSDARYLVDKLTTSGISFYLKEKMPNIYSHFIIADIESYFQIAIGNATKARLLSVINRPNRYLHRQAVENGITEKSMLDFYDNNPGYYKVVESFWADIKLMAKMSPGAAISYLCRVMDYDNFLLQEAVSNEVDIAEYQEVIEFIQEVFKDCRTIRQAIDKLNGLRLKIDYENRNRVVDKSGKVGLYTLHSSKGLEFENVFIISASDGVIPTNKCQSREDIEAERRLFYVGITRCKRNLYITYTNKKNRDKSRFLDEMFD